MVRYAVMVDIVHVNVSSVVPSPVLLLLTTAHFVEEEYVKSAFLENLVQWYPVNAGRLYRNRLNVTSLEPVCELEGRGSAQRTSARAHRHGRWVRPPSVRRCQCQSLLRWLSESATIRYPLLHCHVGSFHERKPRRTGSRLAAFS